MARTALIHARYTTASSIGSINDTRNDIGLSEYHYIRDSCQISFTQYFRNGDSGNRISLFTTTRFALIQIVAIIKAGEQANI